MHLRLIVCPDHFGREAAVIRRVRNSVGSFYFMIFELPDHLSIGGFLFNKKWELKMKKSILLICGLIVGYANNAMAVNPIMWGAGDTLDGCYSWNCLMPEEWYPNADPTSRNCLEHKYTGLCVYIDGVGIGVASCSECAPGYAMVQGRTGITACSIYADGTGADSGASAYDYTYCTKNCNTSTCTSDNWSSLRTGYESRIYRSCSATGTSGTCNSSIQYRCAAGYYGSSSNGTSGCTQCPTWSGVYTNSGKTTLARGTSSAGATAITGCYVAPGTYYDATGTFKTTSNCQYKQ